MKRVIILIVLALFSTHAFCKQENQDYTTKSLLKRSGETSNIVVQNGELGVMFPNYTNNAFAQDSGQKFFTLKALLENLQKLENEVKGLICNENGAASVTVTLRIVSATWERERLCQKKTE